MRQVFTLIFMENVGYASVSSHPALFCDDMLILYKWKKSILS